MSHDIFFFQMKIVNFIEKSVYCVVHVFDMYLFCDVIESVVLAFAASGTATTAGVRHLTTKILR